MLTKTFWAAMLVVATITGPLSLRAQQAETKPAEVEKTATAYRLDFTLNELDDGKKINTRQYSMQSRTNDWNEIKIGSRVPVESEQGKFQYLDVGMNLRCRLLDQADVASLGGNVALKVSADLSNFAIPEQQGKPMLPPTIRQIKFEGSTIAVLGKSMVVGIVDDPNSKRQYQLEVVVTKLR